MKVRCIKDLYMNNGIKSFTKDKIYETKYKTITYDINIVDDNKNNHYLGEWFYFFKKVEEKEIIRHTNRCKQCGKFIKKEEYICKKCREKNLIKEKEKLKFSWYKNNCFKKVKEVNNDRAINKIYEVKDCINKENKIFIYWYRFRRDNNFEI